MTNKKIVPFFATALGLLLAPVFAFAAITGDVSLGSSGADVTALQTYLASDSSLYPEGLVTGYFGALTEAAVVRFQARYGIDQVGRVGPVTRAKLNALMGGGTTPAPTGDISAPIMTLATVAPGTNGATIHWTTSESASNRVMYGTTWPFLFATAPSVSDATIDTSADVSISGLLPHTQYYYVLESWDASGNVMQTTSKTFVTN